MKGRALFDSAYGRNLRTIGFSPAVTLRTSWYSWNWQVMIKRTAHHVQHELLYGQRKRDYTECIALLAGTEYQVGVWFWMRTKTGGIKGTHYHKNSRGPQPQCRVQTNHQTTALIGILSNPETSENYQARPVVHYVCHLSNVGPFLAFRLFYCWSRNESYARGWTVVFLTYCLVTNTVVTGFRGFIVLLVYSCKGRQYFP